VWATPSDPDGPNMGIVWVFEKHKNDDGMGFNMGLTWV
jgi:hypothetical protein